MKPKGFQNCVLFLLILALHLAFQPGLSYAQPYFITGNVKTPAGQAIPDARVWYTYLGSGPLNGTGGECYSNANGSYGEAPGGYLPFMTGAYDIWLKIEKAGYEFRPLTVISSVTYDIPGYYFPKSSQSGSISAKNFTGVSILSMSSGMTSSNNFVNSGEMNYSRINVPSGATELEIDYDGTGGAQIIPRKDNWPTSPAMAKIARTTRLGAHVTSVLVLNSTSNPPLSAGKWYIGVKGTEPSTYTLKTTLRNANPLPTISGKILHFDGASTTPVVGILMLASNGGTSSTTNASGAYQITVPYFWSGEVFASTTPGMRYLPSQRSYSNLEANQTDQNFQGPQYHLAIATEKGNPQGAGWYDSGTTATWSVTSPFQGPAGERYVASPSSERILMTAPTTITVNWRTQFLLNTSVDPAGSGAIDPSPVWFFEGSTAQVSATPISPWTFSNFSGDLSGNANPQTIVMDGPKNIVAHFTTTATPTPTPTPLPGVIRVPQDQHTIQSAINAASPGNEIIVSPGTYRENIHFDGKNVNLHSLNPTDPEVVAATVIDGTTTTMVTVVTFSGAEESSCSLSGFRIINGKSYYGGGIRGNGTHATISFNRIEHNSTLYTTDGGGEGGGIFQCDGLITNCTITSNTAEARGGGMSQCNGTILNSSIFANYAANMGGGLATCDSAFIANCLIYENNAYMGGGIYFENTGTVTNCTIYKNHALADYSAYGGGIYCWSGATIRNSIIWGNTGSLTAWDNVYYRQVYRGTSYYSCIQDWENLTNGAIADNPNFVDASKYDLRISQSSPCVDTGCTVSLTSDIRGAPRPFDGNGLGRGTTGDGSDMDMGAYEYANMSAPGKPVMVPEPPRTKGNINTVYWRPSTLAASYMAQCDTNGDFPSPLFTISVPAPTDSATTVSATFSGLPDGLYWYRVQARNAYGDPGEWSTAISSIQDATAPCFENVGALPSEASTGGTVNITFSPSEPLASNPTVKVNENAASYQSKNGADYSYKYTIGSGDPIGKASITIAGTDLVGYSGSISNTSALRIVSAPFNVSNMTRSGYTVVYNDLQSSRSVYTDQAWQFKNPVPSHLFKKTYIRTRQDDKDSTVSSFLSFDVNTDVKIYIAIDNRITTPPSWLKSWAILADPLLTNDPANSGRTVYLKEFKAGHVTLGPNRNNGMTKGRSMYTVVIVPKVTSVNDWPAYVERYLEKKSNYLAESMPDRTTLIKP